MAFDLVLAHRLLLCVINYCYKNTRQTGIFGNPDYDLEDNTLKLLCQRCHSHTARTVFSALRRRNSLTPLLITMPVGN